MKTLAMTAGNDNAAIWVVKIFDGTNTYRFASKAITLSSNLYDGNALSRVNNQNSLDMFGRQIDLINDGVLGENIQVTFSIKNNASNSLIDGFQDEFYPATSGKIIIMQEVSIGVVWEGATTEAEITWLENLGCVDFSNDHSNIYLACTDISDKELFPLPYYKVQNEYDNKISYFPNAGENNIGALIPIVYGDFTIQNRAQRIFNLSPCVLVDPTSDKFIIASHEFETTSLSLVEASQYALFSYLDGFKTFIRLSRASGTTAVNTIVHTISMQSTGGIVYGDIIIPFSSSGAYNIKTVENIIDQDDTTYLQLDDTEETDLKLVDFDGGNLDLYQLRNFDAYCPIEITFRLSSDNANDRYYLINYWNTRVGADPGTAGGNTGSFLLNTGATITEYNYDMKSDNTAKNGGLPWTLKELAEIEFTLQNVSGTAGQYLRVYGGYLKINTIQMNQFTTVLKKAFLFQVDTKGNAKIL